jgi:hypothetical protein
MFRNSLILIAPLLLAASFSFAAAPIPSFWGNTQYSQTIVLNQWTDINIGVINRGGTSPEGGISVSFPDFTASGDTSYIQDNGSDIIPSFHAKGQQIYNSSCTQFSAAYLLSELVDNSWEENEYHSLKIRVKPNKDAFTFYVRSAMLESGCTWHNEYPDEDVGWVTTDQQGWSVRAYTIRTEIGGSIDSAGPSDFTGFPSRTVTITVSNTGSDRKQLILKCASLPSGWSVDQSSRSASVSHNETYNFTFSVTSPSSESSGTIEWVLYYDDDPDVLLDTKDQSVTKTYSPGGSIYDAGPSNFTGYQTRTVTVNVNNSGGSGDLVVEAASWPSGWDVSPSSKLIYMQYNTSTGFTFDVTSPEQDSTGTIVWHLHSGSISGTQLHSYNQNVTKTIPETVSQPTTPIIIGSAPYRAGDTITFETGGSVDNKEYPVEYKFYWNDGTDTGWGTGQVSRSWLRPSTYYVYAQARSQNNPDITSPYSETLAVIIQDSQPLNGEPPNVHRPALVDPGSHLEVFNGTRFQDVDSATRCFVYDGIDMGRTGQNAFDFTKKTIVLIHGWRPNNINPDGTVIDANLTDWVRWSCVADDGTIQCLGHRSWLTTGPGAHNLNIIAWNWAKNASTGPWAAYDSGSNELSVELNVPYDKVQSEASKLAETLKNVFSQHQHQDIHLVGSSLGAGVGVETAEIILKDSSNVAIDQVTMFDAPAWVNKKWESDLVTAACLLLNLNLQSVNLRFSTHYQGLSLEQTVSTLSQYGVWVDNYRSQFGTTYSGIFNIDFDYGSYPSGSIIENHSFPIDWYFPTYGTLTGTIELDTGEISKDVGAAWSKVINTVDAEQSIVDMRNVLTYGPDVEKKNGRTFVLDGSSDPYSLIPNPDEEKNDKSYTTITDISFSNALPDRQTWRKSGDVYFENGRAIMWTGSPVYLYQDITFEPPVKSMSFLFKMNAPLSGDKFCLFFKDELLWVFDGAAFPDDAGFITSGPIPLTKFAGQTGQLVFVYDSQQEGKTCEIARLETSSEAIESGYKLIMKIPDDPVQYFESPTRVTIDGAGNVYVTDSGNNRIQKFTSDGIFITAWGNEGSGNGQFEWPCGVAVDDAGNVYVADSGNNRIQKFTSDGVFITAWGNRGSGNGQLLEPFGVVVDDAGNVYVADTDNHRIQKFTSDGVFIKAWGNEGSGNGQFEWPCGVAVDDAGNVYVVDTGNARIQKFTSDGVFITAWGNRGSGNGQFLEAFDVIVDDAGNVYVADSDNNHIQKFTSEGVFIKAWGNEGSGNGQFEWPCGVAVDDAGNVYVADSGNNRIQKFTSDGVFIKAWGNEGSGNGQFYLPYGVAVDIAGNVYVADSGNNRIQKFTSDGVFIKAWGNEGSGNGQFEWPRGVAVDITGNVYVADYGNSRIQKFTSDGVFIKAWGNEGSGNGQFEWPRGVAVDIAGNVYVVDTGNYRIQKFTSDGVFIKAWGIYGSGNGQFYLPYGISVDGAGNVYVADSGNCSIQVFTPVGNDFNGDGQIGLYELDQIASHWQWTGKPGSIREDLVPDGIVDFADFSVFAQHWLEGV